jgi:hypothetical protein
MNSYTFEVSPRWYGGGRASKLFCHLQRAHTLPWGFAVLTADTV